MAPWSSAASGPLSRLLRPMAERAWERAGSHGDRAFLVVAGSYWDAPRISQHDVARTLAERGPTVFLEPSWQGNRTRWPVSFADRVAAHVARLATGWGGSPLRRTGFAPAGRQTEFHELIASPISFGPAFPGRTVRPVLTPSPSGSPSWFGVRSPTSPIHGSCVSARLTRRTRTTFGSLRPFASHSC
jgi:hypothetical protein